MSHGETYDFVIKQDDTAPALQATLEQGGSAYDLTGASVKFIMRKRGTTETPKVDSAASIRTAGDGTVEYEWQAGDTDTLGVYEGEWEVTNANSSVTTFPGEGYFTVLVTDDLA